MAGSYEMNMTSGPLLGKILTFSFPLMCSGVLQLLFNAADIIVVGRYTGHTALAAVGSTSALINLIVNLFVGLSVGANVLIARSYGAKNMDAVHKGVHTAMLTAVVGGVFLIFVGVAASRPMLSLMGTPDDVIDQAALYLRIYFVGAPSLLVYNFGAAILRAVGDTRRPLYFLTLAGIINVVLNLVFVIVFSLGVAGVALATIISQTVSAYLIVVCLQHNTGAFRLVLHELRIDPAQFREILRIGVPAGVQGMVFSLSNVLIQSSVNSFGSAVMAGNTAASNIEGFVYTCMNAVSQTSMSFVSQNVGARRFGRVDKVVAQCMMLSAAVGVGLGLSAYLAGRWLLTIYTSDAQVITYGLYRMSVVCTTYFLCGWMDCLACSVRGLGASVLPMVVSIIGACLLRIVWVMTIFQWERTQLCLYISYPVSWALTMAAHLICFLVLRKKVRSQNPDQPAAAAA
ncbi:MAG TPA: MATE family efflux transporter [Candidatus Fournierella pullicola]|uniref:Probable multidrug resistance protein NorM n=1 Tax=Candidatus Allofournierella pullicola TaxID=2838596 RepID=A0A9D1V441_9FIRM|nr:MATE family efflux transporter [Candidatus Fournierella pullicola]